MKIDPQLLEGLTAESVELYERLSKIDIRVKFAYAGLTLFVAIPALIIVDGIWHLLEGIKIYLFLFWLADVCVIVVFYFFHDQVGVLMTAFLDLLRSFIPGGSSK